MEKQMHCKFDSGRIAPLLFSFASRLILASQKSRAELGPMKILVLGSGGREHAIVWKLRQSPRVKSFTALPETAALQPTPNVSPRTSKAWIPWCSLQAG